MLAPMRTLILFQFLIVTLVLPTDCVAADAKADVVCVAVGLVLVLAYCFFIQISRKLSVALVCTSL